MKYEEWIVEVDDSPFFEEGDYIKWKQKLVRCRNCKWWAGCSSDTIAECSNCGGDWKANEYCSCGERREDD